MTKLRRYEKEIEKLKETNRSQLNCIGILKESVTSLLKRAEDAEEKLRKEIENE